MSRQTGNQLYAVPPTYRQGSGNRGAALARVENGIECVRLSAKVEFLASRLVSASA